MNPIHRIARSVDAVSIGRVEIGRVAFALLAYGLFALALTACDKQRGPTPPAEQAAAPSTDQSTEPDGSTRAEPLQQAVDAWKANDTHTHLSPYAYPLAIQVMDESGIHRVVNMSGGFAPRYRHANLRAADRYEGRIALFFNMNWKPVDEPDFGQRMARGLEAAVSEGYAGLKISKQLGLGVKTEDGHYLAVDDERLDPLWDQAGELGVPVGIHTGDPKAFFEKPGPENERWAELRLAPSWSFYGEEYPSRKELLDARDRVVARHPDTTFILLHVANNPEDIDYVDRLMDEHPNVMIDVAARVAEIGRHDAEKVRRFFVKHQDRIVFATDLGLRAQPTSKGLQYRLTLGSVSKEPPTLADVADFYDKHWRYFESDAEAIEHPVPIQGDWKVHPIDLPQQVLDKVYWKNAERVVFAPWLGRRAAHGLAERAAALTDNRTARTANR